MDLSGNHILLTGGATGIGRALAEGLLARGSAVLICGRREERLARAAAELPGLLTFPCDVANPEDRGALLDHVERHFPRMNILINNAGVQFDTDLTGGPAALAHLEDELSTNLEAPIQLSALFTPLLTGREGAAIVHVGSGLALNPQRAAGIPVYVAAKAGLHAFSAVQRRQLSPLGIRVVELLPPMVESELNTEGRTRRGALKTPGMIGAEEYAQWALSRMEAGLDEIPWQRGK